MAELVIKLIGTGENKIIADVIIFTGHSFRITCIVRDTIEYPCYNGLILIDWSRNNRWKPGMNKNQLRSQLRKQIQVKYPFNLFD